MYKALPYKTKQFFFVLIKLSIVIGAFYFIYQKLTSNSELNFNEFLSFLSKNDRFSLKTGIFLAFLSVFNWFFEILKWQFLVSSIKKIPFKQAAIQCLSSLTASLLTPNRIGEYGVKALYYDSPERKKIVALNFLGNSLQMTVTVLLGVCGLSLLANTYTIELNVHKVLLFLAILIILILVFYFSMSKNEFSIKGISIKKITTYFNNLPPKTYFLGFSLSLIRYGIFSFQFYYLLYLLGVNISYFNAMMMITSMYLLASIIPSIFIFDVIIKVSVAVYLFALVGVNTLTILSVVTLMWLLNVVFPSILGSFYVIKFKLPKDIL